MAQPILLHTKFGSQFSTFPKFNTSIHHANMSPTCHFSYPIIQATKTNNLIIEDKSSSTKIPYWASVNREIEAHLAQVMPIREPLNVFEPMKYLTFNGPRSMAPALCIASCELVGGDPTQALSIASALYVMHAAAQAHDNLLTNGPRSKTHGDPIDRVFSPGIELQIGDGLLSFGYELLAGLDNSFELKVSSKVLRVIIEVSRAMGGQGVVEGQFREVEYCESEEGCLSYIYEKKSGEIYACGATCGAIIGGASDEEIEKLRKYGLCVGTIQGLLHGYGNTNKDVILTIQSLKELALKELEDFDHEKTSTISSLLNIGN